MGDIMYSKIEKFQKNIDFEIQEFNKNIANLINEFEMKHKQIPQNKRPKLEDLSGVSRTTIYRIKTGKLKATQSDFSTILKLLTYLTKKEFSEIYSQFKNIFDHVWVNELSLVQNLGTTKDRTPKINPIDPERSKKENTDKMARLFEDPDTLAIYAISKRKEGVSFDTLKSLMGDKFLDKAYLLADAKAINIDFKEEKIFSQEMLYVSYSRENLKSMIPSHIKHYDHKRSGTNSNFIGLRSNCINKETLSEIVRICEIAQTKINALVENKENYGNIPFFSTIVVDRFLHKIED